MSINPRCPLVRITVSPIIRSAIVFFAILFSGFSAYGQSLPGFQAPDKPKVKDETSNAVKVERGEAPFNRIYGHLKLNSTKVKRLGKLSLSEIRKKTKEKKERIGVVRQLMTPLDPLSESALYPVVEGEIRVAGIVSEGAIGIRVQFKDMSLPAGARVFVYSPTNPDEFYGPYQGRGESQDGTFWTPAIQGDTVVIEYFSPGKNNSAKLPFQISSVAHVYKAAPPPVVEEAAGTCNLEVTPAWQDVAKSVGRIDFVSQGGVFLCTGTLLNNAANDQKPYFLTANHCLSTQTEAQSATVYWNYNTGDSPPGGTPSTHGANLLATGTSSDFTLLLLTGSLPGGLFFSGWDSSVFSGTSAGTGIHHPDGSHKRISFGNARQPNAGNCPSGLQCLRVDWSSGVTEGGSSGSGVWIGTPSDPGGPRLIGNLTGGLSACGNPASSMWDVYGRFSVTFPIIASFLEGKACATSLSSTSQSFTNAGGTGSFTVNAPGSCNWTAVSSNTSFITVTSGANGTGNGTVNFSVAANGGPPRSGTIVAGGQTFTINQAGGGACAPSPISLNQTINGTLTTSSCPLGNGTFYNSYSFNANAGQQVAIAMTSSDFDAFLILNRPDGTVLATDDDSGGGLNSRIPPGSHFFSLPVTGTYTIWANAVDPADATGAYSLTLSAPLPRTLTINSSNPNSGISVVAPTDNNGFSEGTTPFTRTYNENTNVTLIAPGTAGEGIIFLKWQKDGVDLSTSVVASVFMDTNHTMTAVYGPIPTFNLTVASSNPSSGVPISVSPNDKGGLGNGSTQFIRTYNHFTTISLQAPIDAGSNRYFQKWTQNGVDFSNNRSVTVVLSNNLTMTAVYVTLAPTPTPTPTPPPTGPGQAVTYQIDAAHTGSQFDTLSPPLIQRWSRNLGSFTSYPLIAGGKVFVTAGTLLYALDAATGATVWGPIDLGTSPSIAYESGRVFGVNREGLLRAFDAANGNQMWTQQLAGQSFTSPPTPLAGTLYVNGFPTLYAVSTQDGSVKWSKLDVGGEHSSPPVTTTGLYLSYVCNAFGLSPSTGNTLWQLPTNCFGLGGRTPAYYNGRVYIRNHQFGNLALDAGTGTPVAEITAIPPPAFHGSTGFFFNVPNLQARDLSTGALKWSFSGDGTLTTPPIVVNGHVYIGSLSGKLYAINESTGANVWTGNVGAPVFGADEHNAVPLVGLGAGEGLIVVPASESVVAFQNGPTSPPVIYVEEGTNNAAVLDSVTFMRGPFRLPNTLNLSLDNRTRITIFTTNLGLTQSDLSDPTALVVEASGIKLTVENVGPVAIPGLSSSYIVVRLPDNLPAGNHALTVKLRGVSSTARTLSIAP